jgi:predicted metal-dependent hydrolase
MSVQLHKYLDFDLEIHRRAMKRNISITIRPQRPIRVSVGKLISLRKIEEFIFDKRHWIQKHQQKFAEIQKTNPRRKLKEGESYLFKGEEHIFKVSLTLHKKAFVAIEGQKLNLFYPNGKWNTSLKEDNHAHSRELVFSFYKREAIRHMSTRVEELSRSTGLHPTKLSFRNQKTRWGSCSSRGHLNLNWRLVAAPIYVIDYVIIHELCHLRHLNHSQAFWDLVQKHDPEYLKAEQWLKHNYGQLDFLRDDGDYWDLEAL